MDKVREWERIYNPRFVARHGIHKMATLPFTVQNVTSWSPNICKKRYSCNEKSTPKRSAKACLSPGCKVEVIEKFVRDFRTLQDFRIARSHKGPESQILWKVCAVSALSAIIFIINNNNYQRKFLKRTQCELADL